MIKKLFLLALTLFVFAGCSNNKAKEQQEAEFIQDVKELANLSYELASESEGIALSYLKAWNEIIFDDETTVNGKTYTDAYLALGSLYMDNSEKGIFDRSMELSAEASILYKNLKETSTEKYKYEYEKTRDFYLKAVEFKDFSEKATGSYNSYNENFNSKRDEIISMYSSLKVELQ